MSLLGGFRPVLGESSHVLASGGLDGWFASIQGLELGDGLVPDPLYRSDGLTLVVDAGAVPEPSSLLMLGLGLGGLGVLRWRREREGGGQGKSQDSTSAPGRRGL